MDSSPQSASFTTDEFSSALQVQQDGNVEEEEKEHIHLPNPSYWPILLGLFLALTLGMVIFASIAPWLPIIGIPFVFICIVGWAIEDSMAPLKEQFVTVYHEADPFKFKIGLNVIDSHGKWLGKIRARFSRHILVDRGSLRPTVYYVPQSYTRETIKNNTVYLTVSEADLLRMELNRVPDDLYSETPDPGIPTVRGAAQFAKRPLSPAETGHYNYGRKSPGINTDASGSYHREEVQPKPQNYVTESMYSTDQPIPPRVTSPD